MYLRSKEYKYDNNIDIYLLPKQMILMLPFCFRLECEFLYYYKSITYRGI